MSITSLSGITIKKGDVIDINQTVYGYSKFVLTDTNPITAYYVNDNFEIVRKYEYDVRELFALDEFHPHDEPLTIVGHIELDKNFGL